MDDALPLDFGLLEIDQKTDGPAGGSQIVNALSRMFVGETFHTFQFNYEDVFNEDIGEVFSDTVVFVSDWK
jgi:hypothetical protein